MHTITRRAHHGSSPFKWHDLQSTKLHGQKRIWPGDKKGLNLYHRKMG